MTAPNIPEVEGVDTKQFLKKQGFWEELANHMINT